MKVFYKAFSLAELLIAIFIASIVLGVTTSIYWSLSKNFKETKKVSDIIETARSGIVTLEYLFSRWGVGVPCKTNKCVLNLNIPDCDGYPPSDPMCLTINPDGSIEFYGNLYGMGYVISINEDNNEASLISCRLRKQDEYYIWQGSKIVGWDGNNEPPKISLENLNPDNVSCRDIVEGGNLTTNATVVASNDEYTLKVGYVINRVPFRIRIYESNGWLYYERTDLIDGDSTSIRIAPIENFDAQKQGRGVKLSVTFVEEGKKFILERFFGR